MKLIALDLTLVQCNLILTALVERPFKQVFKLIGSLNAQAASIFGADSTEETIGFMHFSRSELGVIIEALAELPYCKVQSLLLHLQRQLAAQLAPQQTAAPAREAKPAASGATWGKTMGIDMKQSAGAQHER